MVHRLKPGKPLSLCMSAAEKGCLDLVKWLEVQHFHQSDGRELQQVSFISLAGLLIWGCICGSISGFPPAVSEHPSCCQSKLHMWHASSRSPVSPATCNLISWDIMRQHNITCNLISYDKAQFGLCRSVLVQPPLAAAAGNQVPSVLQHFRLRQLHLLREPVWQALLLFLQDRLSGCSATLLVGTFQFLPFIPSYIFRV